MSEYAVIFDMDGVLVDSYDAHFTSWRRMAESRGLAPMSERQFAETFGRTSREIIAEIYPDCADADTAAAMDAEKEQAYRDVLREHFPEMDGAEELIRSLHEAGFAMAIGSSGPAENVRTVIECLPSGRLIAASVNAVEVRCGKPHPEVFLKAAWKLARRPQRCAVIEDAVAGVTAARRAGMAAVALTGTADRRQLEPLAHRVVDSLRELRPAALAELIDNPPPTARRPDEKP